MGELDGDRAPLPPGHPQFIRDLGAYPLHANPLAPGPFPGRRVPEPDHHRSAESYRVEHLLILPQNPGSDDQAEGHADLGPPLQPVRISVVSQVPRSPQRRNRGGRVAGLGQFERGVYVPRHQLATAALAVVAEQRRRPRCVYEDRGTEVDSGRCAGREFALLGRAELKTARSS